MGFPGGSEVKASASNAGDPGSIPGSGRSPGEGNGNPLQYSCLENPMDRRAWLARVHRIAKSRTRLSDFTHSMEKQTNRHREQTYGHGERRGEGEMYGESNTETYITVCKIDSQQEFALWLRKLKKGLCISLEGWDGAGDGREVQKGGDICVPVADSC